MWTLPGPLSEKLNFKFVINSKTDFSGSQKHKKLHFDTKFHICGSTLESNNFKTCFSIIMKFSEINASQISFRLNNISDSENFISKIGGSLNCKKKPWEHFFQFSMLNISSMKKLLQKPSEIQWNITGTLPGKLKRKIYWALSCKISQKHEKLQFWGYFWGLETNVEFNGFFMLLWISEIFSLYLLVKNSFNFKVVFFRYFKYISRSTIRKNILHSDYQSARWYWCKKDQKNLPQTLYKFFSRYFIVNSSLLRAYMFQNICKNSFSGGKSRKNGIPVIKITFSLQKIPQNYRFPWVNTKTIKYTCRFNTS